MIGDPALQIALPKMNIVTDSVNGLDPAIVVDTLSALSKVTIKGHLEDFNGAELNLSMASYIQQCLIRSKRNRR